MKSVYIVILNWNGWPDTLACIDSILKSDYPNFIIEVIDNNSTDDSVSRIRNAYPDISLTVNDGNLGFGRGCNVGIKHALERNMDYIWLLNNDTLINRTTLSAMVHLAESDSKIGATGSVLYHMGVDPPLVQAWGGGCINLWTGRARHFTAQEPVSKIDYLTGASILLRNEAINIIHGFDESYFMYWEDADLCFQLREHGWKLAVAVDSKVWHKESASLGKTNPLLARYFAGSAARFFRKHAPLPIIPIIIGIGNRLIKYGFRRQWGMVRYGLIGIFDR